MMGPAIVVSGWWFFRNWLMFNDPVFSKTYDTLNAFHLRAFRSLWTILKR